MKTLEALREAIQEELKHEDKLRGLFLNILDSAIEKSKKKPKTSGATYRTSGFAERTVGPDPQEPQQMEGEPQEEPMQNNEPNLGNGGLYNTLNL